MQTAVNNYESIYILNPMLDEATQKDFFKKNKSIIESFGGEINHVDTWGDRHLANPIRKTSRGTYFHMTFTAKPDCIAELERTMKINEGILRYFHKRLEDRVTLQKHMDKFKDALLESKKKQEERNLKKQAFKKQRRPSR